ncbi:hypothetical protein [Croceibacterium ferulae]|uniref:hypothetical protein n=1 Tax=Croceibacterium ferulae TaxID=1854641 RepID=UPI000EAF46A1|nr:hypothetical protein [Croceibacterium ferulae]
MIEDSSKLVAEIEAADPVEQAELLCDAWDLLARPGWADADRSAQFMRCIDAEAFESAAIMLVPEGAFPTLDFVERRCWLRDGSGFDLAFGVAHGRGSTIALALVAACLRARNNQEAGR